MGESTVFLCTSCGYESRAIRWGVSMLDPRRRYMPAECLSCKSYVEVDLTGADLVVDDFHCCDCGSQVFFVEKADAYACPRCGSHSTHLTQGSSYW
jgi:predicted RNA-binding Zn-ribbon protein involved in translation (DUF1610 family)